MNREQIQEEALDIWFSNNAWGTICLGTGFGKTRVGVLAIKKLLKENKEDRVLIVVPTSNLRDNEWVNELVKWRATKYADRIDIECIKTAYKFTDKSYGLIIIDEIHLALSDEYGKVHSIPTKAKMGLTGTPPEHNEEYMERLKEVCPVIYTKTIKEGVEYNILSPYEIINVPITFTRKERWLYNKFESEFKKAAKRILIYNERKGIKESVFNTAAKYMKDSKCLMHKDAKQYWQYMSMRKWACFKASKKIPKCIELIKKDPDKAWIIFSKHINFVEELAKSPEIDGIAYHSKLDDKTRNQVLQDFKDGKFKVLVTAEALDQGYNLPSLSRAIIASGDSVALTFKQRLGRILRIEENKFAILYNLFVENTQEETWVKKRVNGS